MGNKGGITSIENKPTDTKDTGGGSSVTLSSTTTITEGKSVAKHTDVTPVTHYFSLTFKALETIEALLKKSTSSRETIGGTASWRELDAKMLPNIFTELSKAQTILRTNHGIEPPKHPVSVKGRHTNGEPLYCELTQVFTMPKPVNDDWDLLDKVREMDNWDSYRNRQCCYLTFRHLKGKHHLEQLKRDLPDYAFLLSIADYIVVELKVEFFPQKKKNGGRNFSKY